MDTASKMKENFFDWIKGKQEEITILAKCQSLIQEESVLIEQLVKHEPLEEEKQEKLEQIDPIN